MNADTLPSWSLLTALRWAIERKNLEFMFTPFRAACSAYVPPQRFGRSLRTGVSNWCTPTKLTPLPPLGWQFRVGICLSLFPGALAIRLDNPGSQKLVTAAPIPSSRIRNGLPIRQPNRVPPAKSFVWSSKAPKFLLFSPRLNGPKHADIGRFRRELRFLGVLAFSYPIRVRSG